MKRRHFLGSVALGSLASTAGCLDISGGGGGDDGGNGTDDGNGDGNTGPENYDLVLCSETDDAVYQISNPSMEVQDDQNRVVVDFILDYVGPNEDQYSVTPTINVNLFDDNGEVVGTINKAETFSPANVQEFTYTFTSEGWNRVTSFGFEVLHRQEESDSGCLVTENGSGGEETTAGTETDSQES